MASFTRELRDIYEEYGETGLGLHDYPIFDEDHRATLNRRIVEHYWYSEIGLETADQFIFQLRVKMNEIMPYYNKMYEAESIKIDPLSTVDTRSTSSARGRTSDSGTTTQTGDTSSHSSSETEQSQTGTTLTDTVSKSRAVTQDLPQTRLAGNADYATAAQDNIATTGAKNKQDGSGRTSVRGEDTGSTTSSGTSRSTGETEQSSDNRTTGYQGHTAALIAAWRETFINVDMMIINELNELFMQIWSSGDPFTDDHFDYIW
jgi:hypothetical protein